LVGDDVGDGELVGVDLGDGELVGGGGVPLLGSGDVVGPGSGLAETVGSMTKGGPVASEPVTLDDGEVDGATAAIGGNGSTTRLDTICTPATATPVTATVAATQPPITNRDCRTRYLQKSSTTG
jgi:hypothetical protein